MRTRSSYPRWLTLSATSAMTNAPIERASWTPEKATAGTKTRKYCVTRVPTSSSALRGSRGSSSPAAAHCVSRATLIGAQGRATGPMRKAVALLVESASSSAPRIDISDRQVKHTYS
eukprot:scaffold5728_cov36-Tisochrysis_lutea.AAC.1